MLQHQGIYNDLSPKLREKLEVRLATFGKTVRYKFKLERENPDPQKYNGKVVYPSMYNLDPIQWKITDNDEVDKAKQKVKNIGVVSETTIDDRGITRYRFTRVRLMAAAKGVLALDMDKPEDVDMIAALEMHPKNGNGLFPNTQLISVFSRIDETQLATDKRAERSARKKAMDVAEQMSEKDVVQFADAMSWDSTVDEKVLRNMVEELAENNPEVFNDLVSGKKMEIQAVLKRAIDNKFLNYNPADGSLSWTSTQQVIISLGQSMGDKKDIERFADWFLEGHKNADLAYKKIKSLSEKPEATTA